MDIEKTTTADLLRMLVDRDARKRSWERANSYSVYTDTSDEWLRDDIIRTLALRIDGGKDF